MAETLILEGKRCVGVRYAVAGEKREARAEREVIVCSGSINSPKLLELRASARASSCARSASCRCTSCTASARTCATTIRRA